jgi:hypothetical protein
MEAGDIPSWAPELVEHVRNLSLPFNRLQKLHRRKIESVTGDMRFGWSVEAKVDQPLRIGCKRKKRF